PKRAPRLASFEGWSDVVRSALIWLGEADPVASMKTSKADDPERAAFRDLLVAWADILGTGEATRKTVKEVVATALEKTTNGGTTEPVFVWPDFNAAVLAAVNGDRYRPLTASSLGYWLRSHKGTILGDRRFQYVEKSNVGYWWIDKIGADGTWQEEEPATGAAPEDPFERMVAEDAEKGIRPAAWFAR